MTINIDTQNGILVDGKPIDLENYFRTGYLGSRDYAIGNNLRGINHRQIDGLVPSNHEMYGYTFFTRPQLNLTDENIAPHEEFRSLLTTSSKSMLRYVRCMLDPRLQHAIPYGDGDITNPLSCPLVDMKQAFIPVLTNNLQVLTGLPDMVLPTYESKPGRKKEVYAQVDGVSRFFGALDIDATFRTTMGNPILLMMHIWGTYMSALFEDRVRKYVDFIAENERDYDTCIYRITTAKDRRTITGVAAIGAGFPISNPIGKQFDFNKETPINQSNKDITIKFKAMGAMMYSDIIIDNFNRVVGIFNREMRGGPSNNMMAVPKPLLAYFNHRGYPYIDTKNMTLDWYLPKQVISETLNKFKS